MYGTQDASICFKGHEYANAHYIILPPVDIIDDTQHITNLIEPVNLCIEI